MKILLVEDNSDIRVLTKEFINIIEPEAIIDSCSSAVEAKKMCDNRCYDMVITDLGLSDKYLGGEDVAKHAKEVCFSFNVLFSGAFAPTVRIGDMGHIDYVLAKPSKMEEIGIMFSIYKKRYVKAA